MNNEERDNVTRILNNVAIALWDLRAGKEEGAMSHMQSALSWCSPALGIDHSFFDDEGRLLLLPHIIQRAGPPFIIAASDT